MAIVFSVVYADVSDKCIDELVELPNTKENFSMTNLPKDLATAVVKVQGSAKLQDIPLLGAMLGPGPDDKVTEAGITVGCVKELPTEPAGIKALLMKTALEMGKSAVASKLDVNRKDIPSNLGELKGFATKMAAVKTGEVLGIEAAEVPTDLKGMENLISDNVKKKAAKKLGVEKSSIPSDKSELSGFIKKAAKTKIAKELEMKPADVKLNKASLEEYVSEDESLAPIANMVNAANILEILGLINGLSAFAGGGGGGSGAVANKAVAADNEDEDGEAEEKPAKKVVAIAKDEDEDEDEKPAKKTVKQKQKYEDDEDDDDEKPRKKKSNSKSKEREIRYGIKGAFNMSALRESFGAMPGQQAYANYNVIPGYGFEFGAITEIPISNIWSFTVGLNYSSRKVTLEYIIYDGIYPTVYSDVIEEGVVNIPVMLKVMPFGGPLYYAQLGLQMDIPLSQEGGERWGEREADVNITWSLLGWHIGDNFAIEVKNAYGLGHYFKVEPNYGLKFAQSNIALIYMF